MSKHRASRPVGRRLAALAGLTGAAALAFTGHAAAQDDDINNCGEFQAACVDEVAEVNGPLAEAEFSFGF